MAKVPANRIEGFLKTAHTAVQALLFYGPDAGLVTERATAVGKAVVSDLNDPFQVSELSAASVDDAPGRLADEMASLSLMGGRRLVRVREGDDRLVQALENAFSDTKVGDNFLLIEAGDLPPRSKLRSWFEASEKGAAIPCYVEEEAALERTIEKLLREQGKSISPDALSYMAERLVSDRGTVRSEIEKLALYMDVENRIELSHVRACVGVGEALDMDAPVWAAASGDSKALDRALEILFSEGHAPVGILRSAQRHFDRLHRVVSAMAEGSSLETALAALKPPLFFKDKTAFAQHVRRWSLAGLNQAQKRLMETEVLCKQTGQPDMALCGRVLHQLARWRG